MLHPFTYVFNKISVSLYQDTLTIYPETEFIKQADHLMVMQKSYLISEEGYQNFFSAYIQFNQPLTDIENLEDESIEEDVFVGSPISVDSEDIRSNISFSCLGHATLLGIASKQSSSNWDAARQRG